MNLNSSYFVGDLIYIPANTPLYQLENNTTKKMKFTDCPKTVLISAVLSDGYELIYDSQKWCVYIRDLNFNN